MTGGQEGDNCSNRGGYLGTRHATSCAGVRSGNRYSGRNASGVAAGRGLGLLMSAGNLPSSPQRRGEKLPVGAAIPNQDLRIHTTCERPGVRGWGITVLFSQMWQQQQQQRSCFCENAYLHLLLEEMHTEVLFTSL